MQHRDKHLLVVRMILLSLGSCFSVIEPFIYIATL